MISLPDPAPDLPTWPGTGKRIDCRPTNSRLFSPESYQRGRPCQVIALLRDPPNIWYRCAMTEIRLVTVQLQQ